MPVVDSVAPPILGIDEAWDRVPANVLAAQGFRWVAGYVSPDKTGKNLTLADIRDYHAAGIAVLPVWEFDPRAALHGYDRGLQDAHDACSMLAALGWPTNRSVFFAIDFDAQGQELTAVRNYMIGAMEGCAAHDMDADAYGSFAVIEELFAARLIRHGWQTYAWSHGQWVLGAAIRQTHNGISVAGHNVDQDQAYTLDFGQWAPPNWNPGPGYGAMMQPDQLRSLLDGAWATTKEPSMEHPGQTEPLQAWAGEVNKALVSITTDLDTLKRNDDATTTTLAAIGQALTTLAHSIDDALVRLGAAADAESTLIKYWGRIADAVDRLAPPQAPAPAAPADAPPAAPVDTQP